MASIRDKISSSAQPFLQPGEQVQAVFPAQTKNGLWVILTGFIFFFLVNQYRNVVVTDRRILVTDAGRWSMAKSKSVLRELPRSTQIGTPTGIWWTSDTLGEKLFIHKRFHQDVTKADAAALGA